MNRIYELQKKIETARHELDEALLQENRFEYYYEKSTRLEDVYKRQICGWTERSRITRSRGSGISPWYFRIMRCIPI